VAALKYELLYSSENSENTKVIVKNGWITLEGTPMSCRSCRTAPARDRLIEIVNGSASGSVSLTVLAFVAMQ
jgi:hypothetical protein